MELGWKQPSVPTGDNWMPTKVGHRLGEVLYHEPMGLTLYALVGHSTSYGIVFEIDQEKFFEGLRAKPLGGPPRKSP